MRRLFPAWAALIAAMLAMPAAADTLLDNVEGVTIGKDGKVERFTGMLMTADGRVQRVLRKDEKRPKKPSHLIDGKGRFVIPGMIDSHVRLMGMALATLRAENGTLASGTQLPGPRPEDRDVAFGKVQRLLAAQGITAVADIGTTIEDWQTYRRAGDNGTLYIRIAAYAADIPAMALIAGPRPTPWLYDDRLRLNGLHMALDGPLESGKAALKAAPPPAAGPRAAPAPALDDTQLRNLLSRAAMDGFQLAVTAHGDAAVANALGAFAELAETYGKAGRWRIEDAQLVDPADHARFAALGIIVSARPARLAGEARLADQSPGTTGPGSVQPWKSLANAGAQLAFGSGSATFAQSPFVGIAAAISREDGQGQPVGGWQPQERIDRETALAAYTANAANGLFAEGRFGRLIEGERADFVVLDRDPLLASPAELRGIRVLETWIGGRKIHDAALSAQQAAAGPGQSLRVSGTEAAPVLPVPPAPSPPVPAAFR